MPKYDARRTIKFDTGLWEWAVAHIEANPHQGYSSVTDLVKHVLRLYLEQNGPEFHPENKDRIEESDSQE